MGILLTPPPPPLNVVRIAGRGSIYRLVWFGLVNTIKVVVCSPQRLFLSNEFDCSVCCPAPDERCTRYPSIMAPEDIIPVFEGVFVGSSQERRKHMMMSIGAEATEDGGLFAIWNVDTPGQVSLQKCFDPSYGGARG